jgi:transcriptional regulator with GAF, ATPase, and Fis domain
VIEAIKTKLWSVLRDKDVSLAMVYDRSGRILWHRGRKLRGRSIEDGEGFPKSLIRQTIKEQKELQSEDVVVMSAGAELPQSARALYLKSLLIQPIEEDYFLYLDSGSKESFSAADLEVFRAMGELLGETIAGVRRYGAAPGGIAGASPGMDRVRELVVIYALEEEPILLVGETGTGKNHVAELIHRTSGRKGRLVVAHCPAIPESLFESEMFGHRRGAFTGAVDSRSGLVAEAEAGTLFLDEVSEIPPALQAKLLAFVESRRYRVVGEAHEREADVRLIAASNRDLAQEVSAGRFRSDLFYRLNVLPIEIPPLRERPEDLPELVEHHAALLRGKHPVPELFEALARHSWPGNVRELIQVLKRAGIRLPGPTIGAEVIDLLMAAAPAKQEGDRTTEIDAEIRAGASFWDTAWRQFLDRDLNRDELRSLLRRWFMEHDRSLRQLAKAMHIDNQDYPRFVSALHKYKVHPRE